MSKRLVALTAAAALLAFSAAPSFADNHSGGHGGVATGTVGAGIRVVGIGTVAVGAVEVVAGMVVVTAAAGELDPRQVSVLASDYSGSASNGSLLQWL